uniref:DUF306 domain-containing protein n=1 Tax=Desulfovibrio sp. U5L TaxID=596152 RepID=I2Q6J7_9BACT
MKIIVILAASLLFLSSTSFAQRSTEPLDFRGIEWDTHYSAIPGMTKKYSKDEKIDVFKKDGDEMAIGSCKFDTLTYEGFNGRIYKANMTFSTCNATSVFNSFKQKYGECTDIEDSLDHYICTWEWKRIKLVFSIDAATSASEISYMHKMVEREYQTYLKEKRGAKKDQF